MPLMQLTLKMMLGDEVYQVGGSYDAGLLLQSHGKLSIESALVSIKNELFHNLAVQIDEYRRRSLAVNHGQGVICLI